ncbi:hypothetical protein SDC9_148770 [bioreactor metagenome]|uniref:Uncharacterized protein n=1 Tax=bioreactor metagenome TaxID=1076179 RepID=A0A645EHZ4_9ZZZZ
MNERIGTSNLSRPHKCCIVSVGPSPTKILPDGTAEQQRLLRDDRNSVSQYLLVQARHVATVDQNPAFPDIIQTWDEVDQSGFSRTGRSDDSNGLTRCDMDVHVVQRIFAAPGIGKGDMFKENVAFDIRRQRAVRSRLSRLLLQHFPDALGGCDRPHRCVYHIGNHRDGEKDLRHVVDRRHEFADLRCVVMLRYPKQDHDTEIDG